MKKLSGLLSLILILPLCAFTQEVKTKIKLYDDLFFTDSGLLPLPEKEKEMSLVRVISSELFIGPLKIDTDSQGNLFVLPQGDNSIYRFTLSGELESSIGQKYIKQAILMKISDDYFIIYDSGRQSLLIINQRGELVRSWKLPEASDVFFWPKKNNIYVAAPIRDRASKLISCYGQNGEKYEFGSPIMFPHSLDELNARSVAVDDDGNIFVAFRYLSLLRKYSASGKLVADYKIETPVIKVKEEYNLKAIGESIVNTAQRVGWKPILISMKLSGERIFLLTHYPRLEILEIDKEGKLWCDYWKDFEEPFEVNDFSVLESGKKLPFWFLAQNLLFMIFFCLRQKKLDKQKPVSNL